MNRRFAAFAGFFVAVVSLLAHAQDDTRPSSSGAAAAAEDASSVIDNDGTTSNDDNDAANSKRKSIRERHGFGSVLSQLLDAGATVRGWSFPANFFSQLLDEDIRRMDDYSDNFNRSPSPSEGFLGPRATRMPLYDFDESKCLLTVNLAGLKDTSELSVATEGQYVSVSFSRSQGYRRKSSEKDVDGPATATSSSYVNRMFTLPENCLGNARAAKTKVDKEKKLLYVQFTVAAPSRDASPTRAKSERRGSSSKKDKKNDNNQDGSGEVSIPLVRMEKL